jgi:DNA polymerase III subunit epsilon
VVTGTGALSWEGGGGLVDRAAEYLAEGPMETAQVASRVLHVRGNAGAAAKAVFALLGGDDRFAVDGAGVWRLRDRPGPGGALTGERFVVVDVETTGGSPARGHRITEFAAVAVEDGEIGEVFSSLVNPERPIPSMITRLTGISQSMVQDAPPFAALLPRIEPLLAGRVFVAHNAGFDWRFLCAETERAAGRRPAGRRLCTVRLARRTLPAQARCSLDALAEYFDIEIAARHRAEDDAVGTARLLLRLLAMLEDRGVGDWAALEAHLAPQSRSRPRRRTGRPTSIDRI